MNTTRSNTKTNKYFLRSILWMILGIGMGGFGAGTAGALGIWWIWVVVVSVVILAVVMYTKNLGKGVS